MTDNTITIDQLKDYIDTLTRFQVGDQPYTIDYAAGMIRSPIGTWRIVIPEIVLTDIKLEEA